MKGITLTVFFCCCFVICHGQQVVSSGGYAVKSDVPVNWILGGSLSSMPVVDQSAYSKMRQELLTSSEILFKVYPVPVSDVLNIEITQIDTSRFSLELYNSSGVKVINKVVPYKPIMQVDVSSLPSGIYFLRVSQPSVLSQLPRVEKIMKF